MLLRVLTAALVVFGAAAALLFGTSRGAGDGRGPQDGVRPPRLPAAPQPRPTGSVVYGRNLGSGRWRDETPGLAAVALGGPSRLTILRGVTTCCMAWSGTRSLLTLATAGTLASGLGVVSIGTDTYRPLAFGAHSRGLVPGGWSTDGRLLAVSRMPGSGAGVYVARFGLDTFERVVRTPPGKADRVLSVSPNGSRLLLFRARAAHNPDAHGVLYTLSILPRPRLVRLSPPHSYSWCCYFGAPASWAPDGRVAFAAFVPGTERDTSRSAVFVAGAGGAAARRITRWGSWTTSARWSPGGRWILFDRANSSIDHDLFVVHPDGSNAHVIQTNSANTGSCCGQWTPDGRYIVYEHGADDRRQALYVVNVAGRAEPRRLTSSDGPYFSFAVTG